jgi:hypothetical protein
VENVVQFFREGETAGRYTITEKKPEAGARKPESGTKRP